MTATAHRSIAPGTPGARPPPQPLSARALTALVSHLTTGCPNPEGPDDARGPMGPYMRRALERVALNTGTGTAGGMQWWSLIAEKHPEIWNVIGGHPAGQSSLNPQPLPPRSAFLAAVVLEFTERMTLVAEIADLIPRPGGDRGIIIVGGHVAKFVDEVCAPGFHLRWPLPWAAPGWFPHALGGADLIVMGTQFQQSAAIAMDRDLGRTFADAAHALLEAGAATLV
jgi:hypothetical protein